MASLPIAPASLERNVASLPGATRGTGRGIAVETDARKVRGAGETEIGHLARIWYDGWHDAHAQIVPAELTRLRTLASFADRLQTALPNVRVLGAFGEPVGFCIVNGNELYQLYVSAKARGTGVAAALIADAETRLSEGGVEIAWLACAIGNERAARFYEKCGWRRTGIMVYSAETSNGTFAHDVWRYERRLREATRPDEGGARRGVW